MLNLFKSISSSNTISVGFAHNVLSMLNFFISLILFFFRFIIFYITHLYNYMNNYLNKFEDNNNNHF